jgi:hypothetical protein
MRAPSAERIVPPKCPAVRRCACVMRVVPARGVDMHRHSNLLGVDGSRGSACYNTQRLMSHGLRCQPLSCEPALL